jgi:cellulose synthase/poly-beta-1,6-N-acetylglucosamine synthase-like glycosyltransferase
MLLLLVLQILFWLAIFLVFHSYVLFPKILEILGRKKKQNQYIWDLTDADLPEVDILMAVYNEEKVIEQKIFSLFETNYPLEKIHVYIGSDASSDHTDSIVKSMMLKFPQIKLIRYNRTGKSGIINQLYKASSSDIIVLTDANVFFEIDTIYHLTKHYKNKQIGLIGGNIVNPDFKKTGISFQEKKYLERENRIKYLEGISMGAMIGAFGGCYSIRRELYVEIPPKCLVDDFFIAMQVLRKGKKTINELSAICTEDVSNKISEEFRRKVRISAGNFQNLFTFLDLLSPFKFGIAFCFISHKVIRWITPFLLIGLFILNLLLLPLGYKVYMLTLAGQICAMLGVLVDRLFKKIGLHSRILRFITHFYTMNFALLVGFVNYSRGVKTTTWKPTERNQ